MLELFEFQRQSVDFLVDKRSSLLGDDMGLGKTVQAISLDLERRVRQPNIVKYPKTLIVTYLGIIPGWVEHYQKWAPELVVEAIDNKNRKPFLSSLAAGEADIYICHWQALRILVNDPVFRKTQWFHIIADECHALQNRKSKQSVALKELNTIYKTGLSGTPAYDKPDDLWSILNWLYPDYWSSYWKYYNKHVLYTDYDGYRTIVGVANEKELQQEMSGFYIRRRKEEVLLDLPDKYNTKIEVDLHPKQARAYEQMRKDMLTWVGEHDDEPVVAPVVIAQLTRLQQFSDAYGEIQLVKKRQKIDLTPQAQARLLEKGVLKPNKDGSLPSFMWEEYEEPHMFLAEPSTKLDAVMQILDSTVEQVVIFSQFSQVIKLLGKRLEKANISHGLFIGDTPTDERGKIIQNFQNGKLKVFAGTIAAGGVGITLTAASTIIFIDRSWSASMNRQAEDRLHRIGQKNAVQVIDIISRGTLDAQRKEEIDLHWSWILKLLGEGDSDDEYSEKF